MLVKFILNFPDEYDSIKTIFARKICDFSRVNLVYRLMKIEGFGGLNRLELSEGLVKALSSFGLIDLSTEQVQTNSAIEWREKCYVLSIRI